MGLLCTIDPVLFIIHFFLYIHAYRRSDAKRTLKLKLSNSFVYNVWYYVYMCTILIMTILYSKIILFFYMDQIQLQLYIQINIQIKYSINKFISINNNNLNMI